MGELRGPVPLTAGVLAAVLWQLAGELQSLALTTDTTSTLPGWLPPGSPFSVTTVPDLVPDAGLWVAGLLLSLAVVGGAVALGVGMIVRGRNGGLATFLSTWMIVILVGVVAELLSQPFLASYGASGPVQLSAIYAGALWGLVLGWVVAIVVTAMRRRARQPVGSAAPAPVLVGTDSQT